MCTHKQQSSFTCWVKGLSRVCHDLVHVIRGCGQLISSQWMAGAGDGTPGSGGISKDNAACLLCRCVCVGPRRAKDGRTNKETHKEAVLGQGGRGSGGRHPTGMHTLHKRSTLTKRMCTCLLGVLAGNVAARADLTTPNHNNINKQTHSSSR